MLQTMRSAHTCLPRRSSIDAHEIWRHCDFTRVLTKSQIHVIDRRRCQRAGRLVGRLASKIFSSSYLDAYASIVRAMIPREPVHVIRIRTWYTNDPSTQVYCTTHEKIRNVNRAIFYQILHYFTLRNFRWDLQLQSSILFLTKSMFIPIQCILID